MIPEPEFKNYIEIPGEIRGAAFLTDAEYIRAARGDDGLRQIESSLGSFGIQLSYKAVRAMQWLPLRTRALSMVMMRDHFGWQENDFRAMGDIGPKHSFIIRLMGRFIASPKLVFESAPIYWKKYYTVGSFEQVMIDMENRRWVFRVINFKVHVMYCWYLAGYFRRLLQHTFPKEQVTTEEVRCIFKGDDVHEFKCGW